MGKPQLDLEAIRLAASGIWEAANRENPEHASLTAPSFWEDEARAALEALASGGWSVLSPTQLAALDRVDP